jgi:hypothetical protein
MAVEIVVVLQPLSRLGGKATSAWVCEHRSARLREFPVLSHGQD